MLPLKCVQDITCLQSMNLHRFLVYVVLVFSLLLLTDILFYSLYRARRSWEASPRGGRSAARPGYSHGGKMRKFKQAKVDAPQAAAPNTFPINRTELLLEHPQCTPGKSRNRLRNLVGPMNMSNLPMFVNETFLKNKRLMSLPQPFGFKDVDTHVMHVLKFAKVSTLPAEINRKACLRCVVVGNSGVLKASHLGDVIDKFDVIIRMNDAPLAHHEKDVGTRTTFRLVYPESAPKQQNSYGPGWHLVMIAFKPKDLVWLETVIQGKRMDDIKGFWKKIARSVAKKPEEFRLLNPEVMQVAAELIGFSVTEESIKKNIPTSGFIGVTMALSFCDEVSVVGFGYDPNNPKAPLHYYDRLKMNVVKGLWSHNVNLETSMLVKLVEQGVIHDLTGAIQIY